MASWQIRIGKRIAAAFQRRHHEREQRRRQHAEPGKAALAQAEKGHGRNGEKIKQRIGDHGRTRAGVSGEGP